MVNLRPIDRGDVPATQALLARAYEWSPDGPEIHAWRRAHRHRDLRNTLGAFHSGVLIGFVEYEPIPIQIGHQVVAGAIAANLAADPDWRRRKVATKLMDRQLEQLNDNGIAIVAGSVAQVSLMRTLGWEFGSTVLRYELPAMDFAEQLRDAPPSGCAEALSVSDIAGVSMVYRRSTAGRFGSFARTRSWWMHRILTDPVCQRRRELIGWKSAADRLDGYAVVELHENSTRIVELHALTHDSYVGLLRHLAHAHHDSCMRWSAPVDDPLPLVASQPYRLRPRLEPDKMFRVVHVGTVLDAALRGLRPDTSLTVAITDDRALWNARAWRVGPDQDGGIEVVSVDATADTVVPVGTVAAMIGGMPAPLPSGGGESRSGQDVASAMADMLRPGTPAYCREDI